MESLRAGGEASGPQLIPARYELFLNISQRKRSAACADDMIERSIPPSTETARRWSRGGELPHAALTLLRAMEAGAIDAGRWEAESLYIASAIVDALSR
jgi:hypothetical protein